MILYIINYFKDKILAMGERVTYDKINYTILKRGINYEKMLVQRNGSISGLAPFIL